MIVLSTENREPQSVPAEASGQELVAAVAIPKITPYAQMAVQADFGADSKPKELQPQGYTEPNYLRDTLCFMGILGSIPVGSILITGAVHLFYSFF